MNIVVPIKFAPDLVEELEIDARGAALDRTFLRLIINEFDDHAIEQAILLKERSGGQVTVVAPEVEGAEDALFTAAAKGADRLIAEMEVELPAVLGIQAAEKPPRYIVTSLITQAMKTARIEEVEAGEFDSGGAAPVARMSRPEVAAHAQMMEGDANQVADALLTLLKERGWLP